MKMKLFIALLVLLLPISASADYWVTASDTARGPIRLGQDVDWASGDTKIVSEEVIGWYNTHSSIFTVTEVTTTGAQINGVAGASVGGMTTGLVALAGGGQTGATALGTGANNVITSATAGDSVKLPTAATGNVVWVKNSGATAIDIFPFLADSIDALAVNLAVTLHPGGTAQFHAISTTVWESNIDNSLSLNAPTTAKGGFRILAADNTGDTDVTITNAAHGQATVVTVPDSGLATSYVVQSTAAITVAEANVLDGATAGTQVASKAVVADANVNTGVSKVTELHIGATGSETQVNATATEINNAADLSAKFEVVAATNTLGVDECGKIMTLAHATEFVSTLPTPTAGCEFRFMVGLAPAAASYTIVTAVNTEDFVGGIAELEVDTNDDGPSCVVAGDCDTITFVDGVSVVGDWVHVVSDGTQWYVSGQTAADGGATITSAGP